MKLSRSSVGDSTLKSSYSPLQDIGVLVVGEEDLPVSLLISLLESQGARVTHLKGHDIVSTPAGELSLTAIRMLSKAAVVIGASEAILDGSSGIWPRVRAMNPKVVTCGLPAFPSSVSAESMQYASDGVVSASCGVFGTPGAEPIYTDLPIPSIFAALGGAIGIATALVWLARTGEGQHVEASRFASTYFALGASGLLESHQLAGNRPDDPWSGPFLCQDQEWIWLNLPTRKFLARFVDATTLDNSLVGLTSWSGEGSSSDLAKGSLIRTDLERKLAALFMTHTSDEWEHFGADIDVPLSKVRRVPGLWNEQSPKALEIRLLPGVTGEKATRQRNFQRECRLPLQGLKVVDFTQVLAGPVAGRILADLGAEVVKINNPHEDGVGYRWSPLRYHADVNRGKYSVLWDLKSEAGGTHADKLLKDADVVIHNFRRAAADKLGLSPISLSERAPDAVQVVISAFGEEGVRSSLPGYEPNVQSIFGMVAGSEGPGGSIRLQPLAINDYGTGLLGALGAILAHHTMMTRDCATLSHVSLAGTARFIMEAASRVAADLDSGRTSWGARSASSATGENEASGLFETSDGWLYVEASSFEVLAKAVPGGGFDVPNDREHDVRLSKSIRDRFRVLRSDLLLSGLHKAGVTAASVRSRLDVMCDPWAQSSETVLDWRYRDGDITTVGFPVQMSRSPGRVRNWCSEPGKDERRFEDGWTVSS